MNHEKIQELFQLYLDDKLKPSQKEEVENHLKNCKECSSFLLEFKETINILKTIKTEELPSDYLQKLELKLDGAQAILKPDKSFQLTPRVFMPAFAVILVAIFIGYFLKTPLQRQPILGLEKIDGKSKIDSGKLQTSKNSERNQKIVAQVKSIETKKTIEFAKAIAEGKKHFILRGAGPKYLKKKIVKQWQDTISGIRIKESLIIMTQKEWQELWEKHSKGISPKPSLPEVNFNEYCVVAVFMGEQKTGGYGIQISNIEESDENIYIEFIETVPGTDAVVSQKFTQPYHIVVVSKD